jgi:NifU-like protein involved in Fe-S cluster formation
MSDSDLIKLYSQRILALAADIPHLGTLTAPMGHARKRAPMCGSTVAVDLRLKDGRIAEFAQDVQACALGQASASVLGDAVLGRSRAEVQTARDALEAMLRESGPTPAAPFDGLAVLIPAREYPNRHASVLLAFEATLAAFDAAAGADDAEKTQAS